LGSFFKSSPGIPARHSRESGNPELYAERLDSRFRGNDIRHFGTAFTAKLGSFFQIALCASSSSLRHLATSQARVQRFLP
jgi:hypothetical protein